MEKNKDIAIIGAGLVGSLLSIYMAERGHRVNVYERRPDMRLGDLSGGRSINLALSDRGFRALERAGVADHIRSLAIPMKGRMMHSETGDLTFQPYGKEGQAIYSVSRAGLNIELMNKAEANQHVDYHFNQKCLRINLDQNNLLLRNLETEINHEINPDFVFGTDGAFSKVRSSMQKLPRFNYSQDYLDHAYKELTIPPAEDGGWRIEKNALHIWPRKSFMLIALPNLDGSFTCTLFAPFEGDDSFEQLKDEAAVMQFFEKYFADVIPVMPDLVEDFFQNPTSALVTVKCFPWAWDNFLILGDAAHAIVPFYGQGMNCGFEDCFLLDEMIENFDSDWNKLFKEYQVSRKPDADAIAYLAKKNFIEMRDLVADPQFLLRKQIAAKVHELYPKKFIPVYSMVTFSHIPYRKGMEESYRQDRVFEEILSMPGIEKKWDTDYFDQICQLLTKH